MVLNGTYYKLATHKRTKQIVGHKRYQTVWYSTERIMNLRPTSEPSNCGPQAVPDCMVLNGTYYILAYQATCWPQAVPDCMVHIETPCELRPASDTRLCGIQWNVLQLATHKWDQPDNVVNCGPQSILHGI